MGAPGVSPEVTLSAINGGRRVTITDANGPKFFDVFNGEDGDDGVGIASIEQTTTSEADGGSNVFTVTLTNGKQATFTVKNGSKGSSATINGVEALTIEAESGIEAWQGGDTLTLKLSSHSQAASTITEGTFGGRVKASAQSGGQTSNVSLLRNSKLVAEDVYDPTTDDPTVNGEIVWIYKAVE